VYLTSNSFRVYCLGAHDLKQCLDLNPGLDYGLTSNTKVKLYSKNLKNSHNAKKFQKNLIFENFNYIAKLSAGALERAGNSHKKFPNDFSQENFGFFRKNSDLNLKMAMSKTAIRTTIRRPNQKLGPRKHISTYKFINHARKSKHKLKHKETSSTKFNGIA
jgi:hypothetical protein